MSAQIDATLRETFRALADVLIPAAEGMPAASEVGVHEAVLDRILSLRPDLAERFFRGLRAAVGQTPEAIARKLNQEDPEALSAIGLAAAAAYYMQPRVRALIGYPGQENRPADPDETPEYIANGMLQQVIDRGPIYRPTPGR
jgi:hypothetical protein